MSQLAFSATSTSTCFKKISFQYSWSFFMTTSEIYFREQIFSRMSKVWLWRIRNSRLYLGKHLVWSIWGGRGNDSKIAYCSMCYLLYAPVYVKRARWRGGSYRPIQKCWAYSDKSHNERTGRRQSLCRHRSFFFRSIEWKSRNKIRKKGPKQNGFLLYYLLCIFFGFRVYFLFFDPFVNEWECEWSVDKVLKFNNSSSYIM
jgi:hypothetical protein